MIPAEKSFSQDKDRLKSINFIIKLCEVIGIASYSNIKFYKAYVIILVTASIAAWSYSAYGKAHFSVKNSNIYIELADQISSMFLCLAAVSVSISSVFIYPNELLQTVESLKNFRLLSGLDFPFAFRKLILTFASGNIILCFAMILDGWVWITYSGTEVILYYFVRNLQYYQLSAMMFLWFWLAQEIKQRFTKLNQLLEKLCPCPYILLRNNLYPTKSLKEIELQQLAHTVSNISALYNGLCDVVDLVNHVFGRGFLFFIIFTISFMLMNTIVIIVVWSFPTDSIVPREFLYLNSGIWIFENFVKILTLASAGDHLSKEASKTTTLCYGIINSLVKNSKSNIDVVKNELNFLIQQASHRKPYLSASGFFVANSTMIGFIIASITSYVIVAVQLLKDNSSD